jgi:hypothetical protein
VGTAATSLPRSAKPRRFYVAVGVLIAVIAFLGFWTSYFGPLLLAGSVDAPSIIHFHAAVYVGWLALFITQSVLAGTGRTAAHIKLGNFAIGYGVLVIGAGLLAAFGMFALRVRAGEVAEAQGRLLGPLVDMCVFAPLFAAAIYHRRTPELHKRFMIVATAYLLIAAVGRLPLLGVPRNAYLLHLVWLAPILLAMAYDFVRQRLVHPVYALGLVLFSVSGPAVRSVARSSEAWRSITGALASWIS